MNCVAETLTRLEKATEELSQAHDACVVVEMERATTENLFSELEFELRKMKEKVEQKLAKKLSIVDKYEAEAIAAAKVQGVHEYKASKAFKDDITDVGSGLFMTGVVDVRNWVLQRYPKVNSLTCDIPFSLSVDDEEGKETGRQCQDDAEDAEVEGLHNRPLLVTPDKGGADEEHDEDLGEELDTKVCEHEPSSQGSFLVFLATISYNIP
ncbi:uncharacterized protein LOC122093132 [Macadamia integrifolia]|uniref:uncharacterized protein LOC122093132 n=1 Tax=Macadamia integrifolia TaxID=60698 RepID=UPI001C5311F6|nr:uncharacterized protein LOC122093132 [Macadamia integrifolia]